MTGHEFRQARTDARLTQAQAALELGYNRVTIIRWEQMDLPIPKLAGERISQIATAVKNA